MNTTLSHLLPCLLLSLSELWLQAASPSTAFTYQGRLFDGGAPANGLYDLQFTNYDAATGGNALGGFNTNALPVTNGLFTLTLDFGAVFDGTPRWLEISERTNGTTNFVTLTPRQLLAAAPYATYAASAGTASAVPGLTILQNTNGFAGLRVDGPVSAANTIYADSAGQNFGDLTPGLIFGGSGSQEGISSKRTSGDDLDGLDFYTRGSVRMTVHNNGNVGIGTTTPTSLLTVGNSSSPAYCDGTTWVNGSDRNGKEHFAANSLLD